jgi:hypothetical protein
MEPSTSLPGKGSGKPTETLQERVICILMEPTIEFLA